MRQATAIRGPRPSRSTTQTAICSQRDVLRLLVRDSSSKRYGIWRVPSAPNPVRQDEIPNECIMNAILFGYVVSCAMPLDKKLVSARGRNQHARRALSHYF